MVGVTSALAFLHDRRVVHRDVKPDAGSNLCSFLHSHL